MPQLQNVSVPSPPAPVTPPVPGPLLSSNPLQWLRIFGPGAVVASLTIGAGELIFSTRGGALFGFNILWLFLVTLVMKWVLAYSIARHMVIWGTHPFQRWSEGPLNALPSIFFILAMLSFPIWTAFHAGTVGTLLAHLTASGPVGKVTHLAWGILLLGLFGAVAFKGGYVLLEKVQVLVVLILLAAVAIVAIKLNPQWTDVLGGLFMPRELNYPEWITKYPDIASRTPALECITYVGVLGGSSYDYLAYASYLRDKGWGNAAAPQNSIQLDRRWLRAPLVDCTMSFVAVLLFTVVFVICGVLILGAQEKVPSGSNLLTLQAEFVTPLFPQLKQLYFLGALLAMGGTLYGTIEVAPTILREFLLSRAKHADPTKTVRMRRLALLWVCGGGVMVLLWMWVYALLSTAGNPPALLTVLTPANLFTGVLGCGIICLTTLLAEMRSGREWRLPLILIGANAFCGIAFLALGIRAYWDHSGWISLALLAATVGAGWIINKVWQRKF